MLKTGKALKVSIYVAEGAKHHGFLAYTSIVDFLFQQKVAGVTVLKGIAGFGPDQHIQSSGSIEISDRLPIKIEFIETSQRAGELMSELEEMVGTGMIEVQETTIVKPATLKEEK